MDTQTLDQEFAKLQAEFQDVATTVQSLAAKLQAAEKDGDKNATEWLADLKQVAQDIDDEQTQVKTLLLALHGFIAEIAKASAQPSGAPAGAPAEKQLFAPGEDPFHEMDDSEPPTSQQQQTPQQPHHRGFLGGLLGGVGSMGGGGMGGGYYGGGFGQAMEMGMAMNLGANLVNSIFR
jgi:hypothetical protein